MARPLFSWVGWSLIVLGTTLFFLLGAHLGGVTVAPFQQIGVSTIGYYLGATAGSVMIGWGAILVATARHVNMHASVGLGSGLGFLALALMRLWAALSGNPDLTAFAIMLPFETVLFLCLALSLFQISFDLWSRLVDAFRSLNAAPTWVQIWVWFFLLPINMASFVLYGTTKHPLPGWIALGFMFVILSNMSIVLYERGVSKITSLPHLIPWVPLQLYTGLWLFAWGGLSPVLTVFAWACFAVIGISNLFDAYDTIRWFRGEREVMTRSA